MPFLSSSAMAGNSCCAQVSASPSGREAPSRKEKAEREWSSTYIHCQNCQIVVIAKIEKHLIRQLLLVIKTLCTTDFQFWHLWQFWQSSQSFPLQTTGS